jgi:hypothetical protein
LAPPEPTVDDGNPSEDDDRLVDPGLTDDSASA